jgi:VCBS repeat protein
VDDPDGIGAHQTWIAYGAGDGTFVAPIVLGLPSSLTDVAIAVLDFNSDGRPDVAALEGAVPDWSHTGTRIRLYENIGKRRLRSGLAAGEDGMPLPALPGTFQVLAGDLDHNGTADLLALDPDDDQGPGALLLAGLPGTFRVAEAPASLSPHEPVRLADVDEDGRPDLVATAYDSVRRAYPVILAAGDGVGASPRHSRRARCCIHTRTSTSPISMATATSTSSQPTRPVVWLCTRATGTRRSPPRARCLARAERRVTAYSPTSITIINSTSLGTGARSHARLRVRESSSVGFPGLM